jgi:hypothetical protein
MMVKKNNYPAKFSLVLAALMIVVTPFLSVLYTGLISMDFSGWLGIFDPLRTILDLIQASLYLGFTLSTVYLLWSLRRYIKNGDEKNARALILFLRLFTVVAVALVPTTILYSLFPENILLCLLWSAFFSIELLTGVCLGVILIRVSTAINNKWFLALGVLLICANVFDYSGFRTFETVLLHIFPAGEEVADNANLSLSIWGISSIDYEMLDEESRANMEEVTLFGTYLLCALGVFFIVMHTVGLGFFYVILAVLFAQRNKATQLTKDL